MSHVEIPVTCIDDIRVALALGGCFSATVVFVLNSLWEVGVCGEGGGGLWEVGVCGGGVGGGG